MVVVALALVAGLPSWYRRRTGCGRRWNGRDGRLKSTGSARAPRSPTRVRAAFRLPRPPRALPIGEPPAACAGTVEAARRPECPGAAPIASPAHALRGAWRPRRVRRLQNRCRGPTPGVAVARPARRLRNEGDAFRTVASPRRQSGLRPSCSVVGTPAGCAAFRNPARRLRHPRTVKAEARRAANRVQARAARDGAAPLLGCDAGAGVRLAGYCGGPQVSRPPWSCGG